MRTSGNEPVHPATALLPANVSTRHKIYRTHPLVFKIKTVGAGFSFFFFFLLIFLTSRERRFKCFLVRAGFLENPRYAGPFVDNDEGRGTAAEGPRYKRAAFRHRGETTGRAREQRLNLSRVLHHPVYKKHLYIYIYMCVRIMYVP